MLSIARARRSSGSRLPRKLTIPPNAGYGALGKGNIPQNATLLFDIELINVE